MPEDKVVGTHGKAEFAGSKAPWTIGSELTEPFADTMILLTGFNRFADLEANPSELIVEAIAGRSRAAGRADVVTEVLPTEYRRAGERIRELIRQLKPDAILGLGVAAGSRSFRLERIALNLDDSNEPDNAGEIALGRRIEAEGPAACSSNLPLTPMLDALERLGIPAVISNHAGAFVCNHVFYLARYHVEQSGIPCRCGFIHVPCASSQVTTPRDFSLPLALMADGIEACLNVLRGTM